MDIKNIKHGLHECFHNPIDHRSKIINGIVTFLIIISIAVIPLHFIARINGMDWMDDSLILFDKIIITIFTIEYLLRIWSSKNPRKFILSWEGIVDIVSILPFYFNKFEIFGSTPFAFEMFLLLRVIRVLRFTTMYGIEQEALDKCERDSKFYKIPNEKVERVIQKHPVVFIAGMILPLVFTSFALITIIGAKYYDWNPWVIATAVLFGAMAGIFFIKAWLDYNYDVIYITSHRIILQNHELFGSETNGLMYNAITNVSPNNRGFWRWALGLGHIEIETANRDGTIRFSSVRHPHKVVNEITKNKVRARKQEVQTKGKAIADAEIAEFEKKHSPKNNIF